MTNERLKNAYCEILKDIDPRYLGKPEMRPGGLSGLSGLFLSSVSENYSGAQNKVMIIGCETRGWEPLGKSEFETTDAYVKSAMNTHNNFFKKELLGKKGRGLSFHDFTRAVEKIAGKDGLIYSNLFCFSWGKKKGSPIKSGDDVFPVVKEFSRKILNAQLEILKPDYIVFANGIASAPYRREFFPHGEGGRCTNPKSYPERVAVEYFWEFMLDEKIKCFRIHHPSARSLNAVKGRNFTLELLADAVSAKAGVGATELHVPLAS
ncbi:MAG: hypothetical protein H0W47_12440 [Polaromonas sp.]|uniref:hypothetical protein n=1 Tax=Polaromonas sp. TaxID=1869339 RepID=UPI0017A83607|nr:hypothetical protein [Polaromonas sp.]MBA3594588.1 hypothetical protein [Polaromonas sp.]